MATDGQCDLVEVYDRGNCSWEEFEAATKGDEGTQHTLLVPVCGRHRQPLFQFRNDGAVRLFALRGAFAGPFSHALVQCGAHKPDQCRDRAVSSVWHAWW